MGNMESNAPFYSHPGSSSPYQEFKWRFCPSATATPQLNEELGNRIQRVSLLRCDVSGTLRFLAAFHPVHLELVPQNG